MSRVAVILACGIGLISLPGCHQRSFAGAGPSPRKTAAGAVRHFPGVEVLPTRTGGVKIKIISGFVGAGEPLFVVDGMPVEIDPQQGLDWLTPQQIVRIEVLKYPAQTAVYGPRGANGVLLITTTRSR